MLNEIEIAVITYKRASILKKWLDIMMKQIIKFGMLLSIYDSSDDNDTRMLIYNINEKLLPEQKINYVRMDSTIRIDEKVLNSIICAQRKYIWPVGDARVINLEELNKKIVANLYSNLGYISLYNNPFQYDGKLYSNPVIFFKELFWRSTLLGGLIFKREVFDVLKNEDVKKDYIKKYNRNDGFSHLGIFYDLIVKYPSCDGVFLVMEFGDVVNNKKPAWIHRYMEVWCDNLCYLIDQLPVEYDPSKKYVLRATWKEIKLDSWKWLLTARINNGLNYSIYKKYKSNNLLGKVSKKESRIKFISKIPVPIAKVLMFFLKICEKIKRILKWILKGD